MSQFQAEIDWLRDARAIIAKYQQGDAICDALRQPPDLNSFYEKFVESVNFTIRMAATISNQMIEKNLARRSENRPGNVVWSYDRQMQHERVMTVTGEILERLHEHIVTAFITGLWHTRDAKWRDILRFDADVAHTNTRVYDLSLRPDYSRSWEECAVAAPIVRPRNDEAIKAYADVESFRSFLKKWYPKFCDFDLQRHRFALAGLGVMLCIIDGTSSLVIDAYPIGTTLAEFETGIDAMAATLEPEYVIRCEQWIDFYMRVGSRVRVHATVAKDLSELLQSFDLGSHAVAYDGTRLYASQIGRDSVARKAVIVNPMAIYPEFERRLWEARENFITCMPGFGVSESMYNIGGGKIDWARSLQAMDRNVWLSDEVEIMYDEEEFPTCRAEYIPGMRISAIQPDVRDDFARAYAECAAPTPDVLALKNLLGPDRAKRVAATFIDTGSLPDAAAVYDDKLDGDLLRIPFTLKSIVRPRAPDPNWYGTDAPYVPSRVPIEPQHDPTRAEYYGGGMTDRVAKIAAFYAH